MPDSQTLTTKSFKDFLEKSPPGVHTPIHDLSQCVRNRMGIETLIFKFPTLELHCTAETCNGTRFFNPITCEPEQLKPSEQEVTHEYFITYQCNNCGQTKKIYALQALPNKSDKSGTLLKIGEFPSFGVPTPARVITLIGGEREYFLKGRRAENQGLGIAAFAYYRRVVDHQKNRIFDEVIRVAEKIGAPKELLSELNSAKDETQFSKAVERVKHAIPQVLLIDNHNPLTLLHSALSEGLHDQTDEQCLEIATSIRVVLSELADKLTHALKEESELKAAVTKLLNKRSIPPN